MNRRQRDYWFIDYERYDRWHANAHHKNPKANNRQGFANIKGNKKSRG